ncbi:peptidylprolyl isomerase [Campylobacter sp. RM16187]|uniref:peptidylprolyl isomerase n=1 Tax=Campylobacter sp. RM16187 TaxID=1660063 RepID=UPI0021B57343|nr:peptidyl-prolyl cis-trans isomerase [Campylobacter sp. RM16187]
MNKVLFGALSLAAAMSLNAAVYATVDGMNIEDKDVQLTLGAMPGVTLEQLPKDTQKKVIDETINRKLLTKEAKKSGIEKDSEYKNAIETLKDNVALDVWMRKIFNAIKVSEKDVKDFYDKNKDQFAEPAQAKAKHILVSAEKDAVDIINQLKGLKGDALVKKFEEIAKAKSIDPGSGANGGELGWFGQSQMVKPFADAAFALKKGEITTKPVQTQFGYHVIFKEDSRNAGTATFNEVKGHIESNLKMEKFRDEIKKRGDDLRAKSKVEYK